MRLQESQVRAAIRTMVTVWLAGGSLSMPYLSGLALEENILQLIVDLSTDPNDMENAS